MINTFKSEKVNSSTVDKRKNNINKSEIKNKISIIELKNVWKVYNISKKIKFRHSED